MHDSEDEAPLVPAESSPAKKNVPSGENAQSDDYEDLKDCLAKGGQKLHETESFAFFYWNGDVSSDKDVYVVPLQRKRRVTVGSVSARIPGGRCEVFSSAFDGPDQLLWNPGKTTKVYYENEVVTMGDVLEKNKGVTHIYGKGKLSSARAIPKKCVGDEGQTVHFAWSADAGTCAAFRFIKAAAMLNVLFEVKISKKMVSPAGVVAVTKKSFTCDSLSPARLCSAIGEGDSSCQQII